MSLILDALNRADQERTKVDETPGISTVHGTGPSISDTPRQKYLLLLVSGFLLMLAMLVVVYFIGKGSAESDTPKAQNKNLIVEQNNKPNASSANQKQLSVTPVSSQTQQPKSQVSTASNTGPVNAAKLTNTNLGRVQVTATQSANTGIVERKKMTSMETNANKNVATDKPKSSTNISSLYANKDKYDRQDKLAHERKERAEKAKRDREAKAQQAREREKQQEATRVAQQKQARAQQQMSTQTRQQKPSSNSQGTQEQTMIQEAERIMAESINRAQNKPSAKAGRPFPPPPKMDMIRDLPYSVQAKIPTIMYSEHNYNSGRNANVTLNKTKKRKGDNVVTGVKIVDIVEDGIILRYKTHKFKMPALSSWVNP